MNKELLSTLFRSGLQRALLLMALVTTGASAMTQNNELTPIELDKIYTIGSFEEVKYEFTATESGIIMMYATSSSLPRPYSSPVFTTDNRLGENGTYESGSITVGGESFGYSFKYDLGVEAGTSYYFYAKPLDEVKFVVTMGDAELNLVSVSPDQNTIFDITERGQVSIVFNYTVAVDKATLKCGDNEAFEVEPNITPVSLMFELRDTLYQMLDKGYLHGGEPMTLTLTGVRAASDASLKYGTDGTLVLNYICPSKPHMIESSKIPSKFLSYWMPGDEDAKVELTFDDNLLTGSDQKATAVLGFGSAESSDYYSETVPLDINGKTISMDLSGKLRTIASMGVSMNYGTMNLKVLNVRMADGTLAYAPGQGQLGSYSYDMRYEEVASDFAVDFRPEHGASLANESEILLYISDKGVITYTGALFTYTVNGTEKTHSVAFADITKTEDDYGTSLTFAIPEEAKTAENVIVTLTGVQCIDGLDRTQEFTVKYNIVATLEKDFLPQSVTPAADDYVAELSTIDLAYDEEIYVNPSVESPVTVYDAANKAVTTGTVTKVAGQRKVAHVTLADAVTAEGDYTVKIKEGVIGDKDYNATGFATGRTNPELTYKYMVNAKIAKADVRTNPVDGSTVTELKDIVITYVNESDISPMYQSENSIYLLNSDGVRVAEGTAELIGDETLLRNNSMNIALDKTITAPDIYTLQVEDSVIILGTQYNAVPNEAVSFTYTIAGEKSGSVVSDLAPVAITPAAETIVTSLDEFTINFKSNVVVNPYYDVVVYNRAERTKGVKGTLMASKADPSIVLVKLEEPITDDGVYSVIIPAHAIGDTEYGTSGFMSGHTTVAQTYLYEVKAGTVSGVTITPANGSNVESLKDFNIVFDNYETAAPSFNYSGQLLNANGDVVATTDTGDFGVEFNECVFSLDKEITEDGVYTLVLPEGMFELNDGAEQSPEMRFTYTIGEVVPEMNVTLTPADGSTVASLKDFTIVFDDYEDAAPSGSYHGQLFDSEDNVVATTTNESYSWDVLNLCTFSLDKEIAVDGTYKLVFPAGMFLLNNGDVETPELTFTYTVDVSSGIAAVEAAAKALDADVYTTSGVKVRKAGESLDGLGKGLYIVGGRKIVIK